MGISSSLYNGLTGINSYSTGISVVSDNVANANSTGFKANDIRFGDLILGEYSFGTNDKESEGAGSSVLGIVTDFSQGTLLDTSNWSDLAISGKGFFIVNDGSQDFYTRDGTFHIGIEGTGEEAQYFLVNQQGYKVQGIDGDIEIANPDTYAKFYVNMKGEIIAVDGEGEEETLGQIKLAGFTNENGLVRNGGNLYSKGPESGGPFYSDNEEKAAYFGKIIDSCVESSNVDLAAEMINLIVYQAGYNANSKTITTSSELINTSINMIR